MIRMKPLIHSIPLTIAFVACAQLAFAQAGAAGPAAKAAAPAGDTRDVNLRAYAELLRSDIRSQKVAIITEVMEFTEDEDTKFWPVYRQYETDLAKINDDRIALVTEYADRYGALTDADADRLALKALDVEARRQTLKARYYDRLKSVLSPKTAARCLQVEHQILLLLDLQIAASLPIVER
jgi:hypothetical protein